MSKKKGHKGVEKWKGRFNPRVKIEMGLCWSPSRIRDREEETHKKLGEERKKSKRERFARIL